MIGPGFADAVGRLIVVRILIVVVIACAIGFGLGFFW